MAPERYASYIEFEDDVDQAFKDLVQETLEQSAFIETHWVGEHLAVEEVE